jgi:hypothetical protein
MGIKRLSYKDIPTAVRARAATEAQRRLQGVLSDPLATREQRDAARERQGILRQWTAGTLGDQPPPTEPPSESSPADVPADSATPPTDHTVIVDESLQVRED